MRLTPVISHLGVEHTVIDRDHPLDLDAIVPGEGAWHVELGFGKGRWILRDAAAHPEARYLGVELVSKYQRLVAGRAAKRNLGNVAIMRGEALSILTTLLPRHFADTLHIYFPDPWPKNRHHKRRLLDEETLDLPLGVLRPGGKLLFASDHLDYGERVSEVLASMPGLHIQHREEVWPDGARTNYEAKFIQEGRPILRLEVTVDNPGALHPTGRAGILAATAPGRDE